MSEESMMINEELLEPAAEAADLAASSTDAKEEPNIDTSSSSEELQEEVHSAALTDVHSEPHSEPPVKAERKTETKAETRTQKEYPPEMPDDFPREVVSFKDQKKSRWFGKDASGDGSFTRDEWILSRIRPDEVMDYLRLEQRKLEFLQQTKEARDKRILSAFQLAISLAAIVAVIYLLKDNPTILISILYIIGIIAGFWIWKNPHKRGK